MPDSAAEALTNKLKERPEMQQAELGDHFILLLTELFSDTWFTVPHDKRAHHTLRGTKPGDPFGDIAFNYLFGRVLKSISNTLEEQGFKVMLTPADQSIQQDETLPQIQLSEAAFVDDLMIVIPGEGTQDLMTNIQKTAAVVIDESAEHGLTINLSPGKTEAMIIRSGAGIRKAMEASQERIQVQTKHCGVTQLVLTWKYKHLGGMLNGEGDMDPEIERRNAMATAYDLRMATKIYKEMMVHGSVRLMLSNAVSFSRLRCNCQIWTKLTVKQSRK